MRLVTDTFVMHGNDTFLSIEGDPIKKGLRIGRLQSLGECKEKVEGKHD